MNLKSQKQMAAKILKCGMTRVRTKTDKEVEEAITREDIRGLIKKGLIWKVQKKGQNKSYSRKRLTQKKRGRGRGFGSRKGKSGARTSRKTLWIKTIRAVRDQLKKLKMSGQIDAKLYRRLYRMAKGGTFKSRKHIMFYLKDHELLKERVKPVAKKAEKKAKPKPKKPAKKPANKKPAKKKPAKKTAKKVKK